MNSQQERKVHRSRLIAPAIVILVALSFLGSLFYRQRIAASGNYPVRQPQDSPKNRQARIQKARMLRDKWQKWALAHKQELIRLVHAEPNDLSALTTVYNAIPGA